MSRQKARAQQTGLIQFPGLVHFIVVLIISAIELIGLVIWLQLESGMSLSAVLVPLTSLSQLESLVGRTGFAGIVLGMFLLVEHMITQVDQTGRLSGGAFLEIFAFSILESSSGLYGSPSSQSAESSHWPSSSPPYSSNTRSPTTSRKDSPSFTSQAHPAASFSD